MTQLSAQSIKKLCQPTRWLGLRKQTPMITPFQEKKIVVRGKSGGLGPASYDVHIAHDLTLGVNPAIIIERHVRRHGYEALQRECASPMIAALIANPPSMGLATSVEKFAMPDNVMGVVCDKSTYARMFVTAFNTLFDPGFQGDAVLELVNLGTEPIVLKAGDPICQFEFRWLDRKTDRPYRGKYQGQRGIQGAIFEGTIEERARQCQ